MWAELKRVIKPKGAIVLFAAQPFTSALVMSNAEWFKYAWVWDKVLAVGHLVAKVRPMQQTEDIVVFGDGAISYFPIMRTRDRLRHVVKRIGQGNTVHMAHEQKKYYDAWLDERNPTNLIEFSNAYREGQHPTQKPIDLLRYLVRTYTNPGEVVLDFTMGSGTTGVACVLEERKFIGIELERQYYDIAERRIYEATLQQPLFAMAAD